MTVQSAAVTVDNFAAVSAGLLGRGELFGGPVAQPVLGHRGFELGRVVFSHVECDVGPTTFARFRAVMLAAGTLVTPLYTTCLLFGSLLLFLLLLLLLLPAAAVQVNLQ